MALMLKNNAVSRLAGAISTSSTSLSVTAGDGGKFPVLAAGDWFPITLIKADGTLEITQCTARSGDVLTVTRAQESTAALAFAAGDRVELRLTAGALNTVFGGTTATPTLGGLELSSASPYVDFHFNSSTADFTSRIFASASGELSINSAAGNQAIFNDTAFTSRKQITGNAGLSITAGDAAFAGGGTFTGLLAANNGLTVGANGIVSAGVISANAGTVGIRATTAAGNAHTWYYNSDATTRGITYFDSGSAFRVQGSAQVNMSVTNAGVVSGRGGIVAETGDVFAANGNVRAVNAIYGSDGNITGPAWGGGSLSNDLSTTIPNRIASQVNGGGLAATSMLRNRSGAAIGLGATVSGASLNYADTSGAEYGAANGTWKAMNPVNNSQIGNFLRVG